MDYARTIMYSVVRLVSELNGAPTSSTGFLYAHQWNTGYLKLLVTNAHCIEGLEYIDVHFHAGLNHSPIQGESIVIRVPVNSNNWYYHPNTDVDLCCCPIDTFIEASGKKNLIFSQFIPGDVFVSKQNLEELNGIEEVLITGFPNGIYDSFNNMPVSIKGITATDINLNHEGYEEFLISAPILKGSSGSPVFTIELGFYKQKRNGVTTFVGGDRYLLAGIVYSIIEFAVNGEIVNPMSPKSKVPTYPRTHIPAHLSYVIKIHRLAEMGDALLRKVFFNN